MFDNHTLGNPAYPFDCTFFSLICIQDVGKERELCLTAKTLRRIAMRSFLVGATMPEKRTLNMPFFINDSRCKRIQPRDPELP